MLLSMAYAMALWSFASAVPFKRYDNGSEPVLSTLSAAIDTTTTVNKYITVTLPASTITGGGTAATSELPASTIIVTEYTTLSDDGSTVVSPVATLTSTLTGPITTSTVTSYITITSPDGSVETEAVVNVCTPTTVTVTVDKAAVGTLVVTTSLPVTAAFTLSGLTTTITSFVDVTTTLTTYSTLAPVYSQTATNGTLSTRGVKRGLTFDL